MTFSMDTQSRLRSEFTSVLNRFSIGQAILDEVQYWLLSHLQTILDSGDATQIEVANELDADLIQLSEHLIDEAVFLRRAGALVARLQTQTIAFDRSDAKVHTVSASASETIIRALERPLPTNRDLRVSLAFAG